MAASLEKMSLEELQAHQREVEATIKGYEKKRKADCLAELKAVAKKHGFSLDDFTGGKSSSKSGPKGVAKYANPADLSQTWTGRGRQPNWIKDALASGKSLEEFAI
ncbi:H-NS family nucleoid-associated regulatory protein [Gymnodinialimonas ceratoperidinii]|uniref:H-NS histone family protein n=1 Tax=Gymnodinialimonas ceratoperidinii TaxID=2856823 RepID=A0A8F6YDQ8_9RHOB|nr:H-NS histone family protein [Gymnodinialimonas ceratoperidinii]QXT40447.1 H-NS histone family protein [Gymnodinialimonas ceratoperidinii]